MSHSNILRDVVMTEVFCMAFDHNYLPHALVALRTIHQHDPGMRVQVLALTDACQSVLTTLNLPNVESITTLEQIERRYPELPQIKKERSTIEYYFTLTPFFPHYLFETTDFERIIQLDADLCFYASTLQLRNSSRESSVSIVGHRFSPLYKGAEVYGIFNVGWISYSRTEESMHCLERYKNDCTEWCYDRVDDGRFADQKYLDSWPENYPGLQIINDRGVNLAIWNADNYEISEAGGIINVDDEPLIFYHFSGASIDRGGVLTIDIPPRHAQFDSVFVQKIAKPYLQALSSAHAQIIQSSPFLRSMMRSDLRHPTGRAAMKSRDGWLAESPVPNALGLCLIESSKRRLVGVPAPSQLDECNSIRSLIALLEKVGVDALDADQDRARINEDRAERLRVINVLEAARIELRERIVALESENSLLQERLRKLEGRAGCET